MDIILMSSIRIKLGAQPQQDVKATHPGTNQCTASYVTSMGTKIGTHILFQIKKQSGKFLYDVCWHYGRPNCVDPQHALLTLIQGMEDGPQQY